MHGSGAAFCRMPFFYRLRSVTSRLAILPITRFFYFLRGLLRACLLAYLLTYLLTCLIHLTVWFQVHHSWFSLFVRVCKVWLACV